MWYYQERDHLYVIFPTGFDWYVGKLSIYLFIANFVYANLSTIIPGLTNLLLFLTD